jgi:hypothetical protein
MKEVDARSVNGASTPAPFGAVLGVPRLTDSCHESFERVPSRNAREVIFVGRNAEGRLQRSWPIKKAAPPLRTVMERPR